MSIKPNYESYRYTGEVCNLQSQSMVECRLPGSEIGNILAVQAKTTLVDCTCADGEVRYNGKLLLCVVYEDLDGQICRAERGAEFFHKADGSEVSPACFAKTLLTVENVNHRREGSGLYISVVIAALSTVYGARQMEYLVGGDNMITQTGECSVCKSICVSGETESEDEFETEFVGDILLHDERAIVSRVSASAGQIDIEGELALGVCVFKGGDELCSYERLIPFRMQIPCEDAFGQVRVGARVCVKDARLTAAVDEDKNKSKILFEYALSADCFLHTEETFAVATDAFSDQAYLTLKRTKDGGMYLTNAIKCVERVSGVASVLPALDGEYSLRAALLPRVEAACRKGDNGWEMEGAVLADLVLRSADGGNRTCTLTLPFVFPLHIDGDDVKADGVVCGLKVRRQKSGETEVEATVQMQVCAYERREWEYIGETVEGEAYEAEKAAISVYALREGEGLWEVAKRLRRNPDELVKSNPTLEFPVKAGQRIFVYRKI